MRYWLGIVVCFLQVAVCQANDWAFSDEWLALGHYQKGKSSIDSPNFFLSKNGKTNPEEELKATVALFEGGQDEKKCLFPARYLFLKNKGLITRSFPKCDEYEQFRKDLQPAGVTLLFTDAYMNNPSSMFGHTLFRIDTKRKGTQLLAHGANYGAFTGDNPGAMYAVLGLTGGYMGGFTVKPYYDIINTYNNIENRDIWELSLNLTQEELDLFVAHLWEVGQTQSRYFFFSRNCSYMLMEMLDAVRPSLKLAKKFPAQAIPLDTFKAVYRAPNLVKDINYRPSRQNKIRAKYNQFSKEQKKAFIKAIKSKNYDIEMSDEHKKSDVWEAAYQFVQYQYVAKKLEVKDYRKQSFDILRNRSKFGAKTQEEKAEGKSPLKSHEAKRLTFGLGSRNGNVFEEVAFRPAYQSLTDNNYGLLKGAEINFLETAIRHYDNKNNTVLQNFDLVSIRSISPIDEMFAPLSFQVKANIERWQNPKNEREGYVGNLNVGTGGAFALADWLLGFVLFDTKVSYGGFLPHNSMLASGVDIGMLADFDKLKILTEIKPQIASQKIGNSVKYSVEANYLLGVNLSLSGNVVYENKSGKNIEEFVLGGRFYF